MSARFVINSLDFVNGSGRHCDTIPILELVRLHDWLFDDQGSLIYELSGYVDKNDKPHLLLKINGTMNLSCQRCLDKLTHTFDLQTILLLVNNEEELDLIDEDDSVDAILSTSELDVIGLIEEEIILSLSISSRHPEGTCNSNLPRTNKTSFSEQSKSAHPFAVLANFKKTN